MEKSFDFGALLRNNEKKHKIKPTQFVSVAGGVQKRLENNIKNRRSTRLTVFDRIRNLPSCISPDKVLEAQSKVEHRRQQLEKWKAEKEKKKKEEAALKKKPFIAGVPHAPLKKYIPPPPPPKPSTSGRVTRSQTAKNKPKTSPKQSKLTQSFAPKNASFRPPEIKNLVKLPKLAPPSKFTNKKSTMTITFEPVIPKAVTTVKQTRSRAIPNRNMATDSKNTTAKFQNESRRINTKSAPKNNRVTRNPVQSSSSSSDMESNKIIKRVKTPYSRKTSAKESKTLTPKILLLESTSDEKTSSELENSIAVTSIRKCTRKTLNLSISDSSSDKISSEFTSFEEQPTIKKSGRKSVPKTFTPLIVTDTSSDKVSDVEIVEEKPVTMNKTSRKSLANTPKTKPIPKSESSSEEKLRSPKSPVDLSLTPEQMEAAKNSPFVTFSRGKDNARKETMWKRQEGLLDDDAYDAENVDHFRWQLASETKRMTELCETWEKISEQTLPESVQEAVLAAVGQARLLMSQKLQQFATLVERAARPASAPGAAPVHLADLQGFWDMLFMQVENIDMRFKKLEALRARGWVEEQSPEQKKKFRGKVNIAKKTVKPAGPSRLREMIAAARKAKKEQEETSAPATSESPETRKSFEAGFFTVQSPVRALPAHPAHPAHPAPSPARTPRPLLRAVLSSEARRASASRNSASFAMLRASMLGKNAEYDGVAPLEQTPQVTPINLHATPGRSILKASNLTSNKKSGKKSIKLVLFNDSDQEITETEGKPKDNGDVSGIRGVEELEKFHNDSGMSSMDVEKNTEEKENKENNQKPRLLRQNAIEERSPVMTRSLRKSINTPKLGNESTEQKNVESEVVTSENKQVIKPKRSSRKKKVSEDMETEVKTPRQSRRKKSLGVEVNVSTEVEDKPSKRSARKKMLQEVEMNVMEEILNPTPKRSSRRRKSESKQGLMT